MGSGNQAARGSYRQDLQVQWTNKGKLLTNVLYLEVKLKVSMSKMSVIFPDCRGKLCTLSQIQ